MIIFIAFKLNSGYNFIVSVCIDVKLFKPHYLFTFVNNVNK